MRYSRGAIERLAIDEGAVPVFEDKYTTVLTLDNPSQNIAELSNAAYTVDRYRNTVWTSQYPEYPLLLLNRLNSSFAIHVANDNPELFSPYENGYIKSHMMSAAPEQNLFGQSKLYVLPQMVPPSSSSDTILVIPETFDPRIYYAYDILSLSGYNYTTSLIEDELTMKSAKTIIAPSEELGAKVMEYRDSRGLDFKNLVILNTAGIGPLMKSLGVPQATFDPDDQDSSVWKPYSYGNGSIGTPEFVTVNSSDFVSADYAPQRSFIVDKGESLHWGLARDFETPIDVSNYHEMEIELYGNGDSSWYVVEAKSGEQDYFWYRFMDTWKGWGKLKIPIQISDGRINYDDIHVHKVTRGEPSWSEIAAVEIRTEASSTNRNGTFGVGTILFRAETLSNSIVFNNGQELPLSNPVIVTSVPESNMTVNARYDAGAPFLMHSPQARYDIHYVNVLPLIETLESQDAGFRNVFADLKGILEPLDLGIHTYNAAERTKQEGLNGGVASFGSLAFEGKAGINATSVVIELNRESLQVRTESDDLTIHDVSRIIVSPSANVEIRSQKGEMVPGLGLYSRLSLQSPEFTVSESGADPAQIVLEHANRSRTTIVGSYAQFKPLNAMVVARQPFFDCTCTAQFANFTAFGELRDRIGLFPSDLMVQGRIQLHVFTSDKVTVADFAQIDFEKIERNPPTYGYNELSVLFDVGADGRPKIFSVALLMAPVSVLTFLALGRSRRRSPRIQDPPP